MKTHNIILKNANNEIFSDEIAQSDFVGGTSNANGGTSNIKNKTFIYNHRTNHNKLMKTLLIIAIFWCTCYQVYANDSLKTHQANQWLQNAPLQFTENKGQIKNAQILYAVKAKGLQIALSNNQIQYTWTKITYKPKKESKSKHDLQREMPEIEEYKTHSIQMQLLHTNPNVQVIAENPVLEIQNYYNIPSVPEGITNVKSYTKIIYKEIYPKIDLVFYTGASQSGLKYDFLVHPGGNPKNIQIQYSGQDSLYLDKQGNLTLKHALGELTEAAPYTYQGDTPIPCQYQLTKTPPPGTGVFSSPSGGGGGFISFTLGDYDTMLPLTIDPDLIWATYYGGTSYDAGNSVAVDGLGNVYLAGDTQSTLAIASIGFQNAYGGGVILISGDAFVVKFNASGARVWATYYGGSGGDVGNSVAVDGLGNVYLAGNTASTTSIASGGFQNTNGGGQDAFLVKFNASGARIWATYYGGSDGDAGNSVAVDGNGNVYLAGFTKSTTAIASAVGSFQNTYGGGNGDAFVVKFNASGARLWATYYGGSDGDGGSSVVVDGLGNVHLAGLTSSTTAIASGAFQNTFGGNVDAFVVKFDASGARLWATYYGGSSDEDGRSLAVDGLGNVYLAGATFSNTAIASGGFQNTFGGGSVDAYVVKFNASGARIWATYYGGAGDDAGNSLVVDGSGNVYLAGYTSSTTAISFSGFQNTYGGGIFDAFIVKFNALGARLWATYYGGTSDDRFNSVAIDGLGNVCLAGNTQSTTAIASGGFQNTYGGGQDAFLAKLCSVGYNPIVSIQSSDADLKLCKGESLTLTAQVQNNTDSPQRVWRRNGLFISNDNAVSSTDFNNGDVITLELVYAGFENGYDATCIKNNIATVQLTVIDYVTPTVAVSVEDGVICSANPVTLNALTANVGATPTYKWYRKPNGSANFILLASTTVPTYPVASGLLKNGDKIRIDVTFSTTEVPCYTTPSNTISSPEFVVSVTPTLTSSVSISANISSGQSICNGNALTFYATDIANGGAMPQYIWKVNGIIKDTTDVPEYTSNAFTSNVVNNVSVGLLSSYPCLSNSNPVSSANFSFTTQSNVNPFVSLQALDGTAICVGEYARFKANPTGGGVEPLYRWYVNNIPQGDLDTKDIFGSIDLLDKDTVSVSMISGLTCASPQVVNSNEIVMQVNPAPTISVSLNASNPICQGSLVIFTANAQNQGNNATYQWRRNGQNITGATASTYTITNIDNTSQNVNVDVVLTTTVNCNEPVAISNPITLIITNAISTQVSIKSRQGFPICAGSDAIFEIDQINLSDPSATYVWKVNGNPVANSNVAVFNAGVLQNGQTVQLQYTTTLSCANPKTVNSNTLTINTQPLIAPNNLSVTASGTNRIDISWNDNSSNETGFRIERSIGNDNNFQFLTTKGSNETFHSDQNVTAETLYFYRVRALNGNISGCVSAYTSAVGAATDDGEIITALPKDRENGFKVFPNPSQSGIFQLHWLTEISGKVNVAVFNLMNAKVFDANFDKSSLDKTTSVDISKQSAGMYYLKVSYQDKQYFVRMVRE